MTNAYIALILLITAVVSGVCLCAPDGLGHLSLMYTIWGGGINSWDAGLMVSLLTREGTKENETLLNMVQG